MKRPSSNALWWLTFVPLVAVDALATWAFSWHRPWWLNCAAGLAYCVFASAVGSHFGRRAKSSAPREPS